MNFNSINFALFFALIWGVVLGITRLGNTGDSKRSKRAVQARNGFLLLASYIFYAFWDWRFLGLILVSTLVDFGCGRLMARCTEQGNPTRKKTLLWISVVTNLGILGFFKYAGFFVESAAQSLDLLGISANLPVLKFVLPVGISFYTFQTLSYTIDLYRGRISAEPSLLNFATYVAFFPQLVAGPIERARDLLPQFKVLSNPEPSAVATGLYLMAWGLFKKVVVADNVAKVANIAFGLDAPSGLQTLLGAYAFAIQIYCDFSGYTDIARGTARCLGFKLSLNFNLPYFAQSPSDFWRRWHISLSSWLRDYLYIPLGGNRRGTRRTYINLMLTMLLGGLWHGAAWNFVAWGAFHGALLMAYALITPRVQPLLPSAETALYRVGAKLNRFFFFQLVCLSWLLFRASDLGHAWRMLSSLVGLGTGVPWVQMGALLDPLGLALFVTSILLAVQILQHRSGDQLVVLTFPWPLRSLLYAAGALIFLYLGEFGGDAFIYFQF